AVRGLLRHTVIASAKRRDLPFYRLQEEADEPVEEWHPHRDGLALREHGRPGAERCELRGGGPDVLEEDDRAAGEGGGLGDGVEAESVEERADGVEDRTRGGGVTLSDEPSDCEKSALLGNAQAVAAGVEEFRELGNPLVGEVGGVQRKPLRPLRGGREAS